MTMATKTEIFEEHLRVYLKANKKEKGKILSLVCRVTHMHPKAAIRKFRRLQMRDSTEEETRGRPVHYTHDVTLALKAVWEIAHRICAERLKSVLEEYINILSRDKLWLHSKETTTKLCAMSLGTMKDRIETFERIKTGGGRCLTKPSDLKELIPVRRGPWQNPEPGFGEIDTVAHCGGTLVGEFAWTVQYTDVVTTWCMFEGQLGRGKVETLKSMKAMHQRSPFPHQGYDPDTGSEFINWNIKEWCDEQKLSLTRIRPGEKDDHGRIEQKNYANIRQYVGYLRIDTEERLKTLKALYRVLELYVNHFLPSFKCRGKKKIGSRYIRDYDASKTPYQRVLEEPRIRSVFKKQLKEVHYALNPKVLHDEIQTIRAKLFKGAKF